MLEHKHIYDGGWTCRAWLCRERAGRVIEFVIWIIQSREYKSVLRVIETCRPGRNNKSFELYKHVVQVR
jgi:hypothetical protein